MSAASAGRGPTRRRPATARPVTPAYLANAAAHHLERYAATAAHLQRILTRKARRRLGPGGELTASLETDIAGAVEAAVRSGLVCDRSFADARTGSLMRRGTSVRGMRAKLRAKGVGEDGIAAAFATAEPDDLALARRYAERKRLGPFRIRPDPAARERDLAALCRAGFPYGIAKRALETDGA